MISYTGAAQRQDLGCAWGPPQKVRPTLSLASTVTGERDK